MRVITGESAKVDATILLLFYLTYRLSMATATTPPTTTITAANHKNVDNFAINHINEKYSVDSSINDNLHNNNNATFNDDEKPSNNKILRRGKRYLLFAKGSRMSWRTTMKQNIVEVNNLWGYGYGFRVNFPFPGIEESRRPFFKRDLLKTVEDMLDGHGFDGRACVLKSYCSALLDGDSHIGGGMLFKIFKLIFR